MSFSVAERGRQIATFRYVAVHLMETAAAWTPTTPELEIKVMLGRHIWDFAQHADVLGKRTFELRLPPQHSVHPAEAFSGILDEVAATEDSAGRLQALYTGLLPVLAGHIRAYLDRSDPVLDQPSNLILERIRSDLDRIRAEAEAVAREVGLGELTEAAGAALRERLTATPLVANGEEAPA